MRPPAAHRATTAHLQAVYPFVSDGTFAGAGPLIGRDLFSGPFRFDPWELYAAGVITSPNMLVLGQIGTGKSALKKSYLLRQIAFGRWAVSINAKQEDDRLCEALGVEPIRLSRGGMVRLNPLDRRIAGADAGSRYTLAQRHRLLREGQHFRRAPGQREECQHR